MIYDKTNEDSVANKELHRLILMSEEYGIGQDSIGIPEAKVAEYIHSPYYENNSTIDATDVAKFLYQSNRNWSDKGISIIIDGGNIESRRKIGEFCLFRFLVYNFFKMGTLIENHRMSEITTKFSTFDQNRFKFSETLSKVPCLFIQEISTSEPPRNTNDCTYLLDSVFFNRIKKRLPTIMSLSVENEKFVTPEIFGKDFSEIIQSKGNNVFKVRLK